MGEFLYPGVPTPETQVVLAQMAVWSSEEKRVHQKIDGCRNKESLLEKIAKEHPLLAAITWPIRWVIDVANTPAPSDYNPF